MITVTVSDKIHITIEDSELDFDNFKPIKEKILEAIHGDRRDIVIDLGKVAMIDSAGIAMLIKLYESNAEKNRKVEIVNPTQHVRNTLKMVNLGKVFNIE